MNLLCCLFVLLTYSLNSLVCLLSSYFWCLERPQRLVEVWEGRSQHICVFASRLQSCQVKCRAVDVSVLGCWLRAQIKQRAEKAGSTIFLLCGGGEALVANFEDERTSACEVTMLKYVEISQQTLKSNMPYTLGVFGWTDPCLILTEPGG